jgi:hypothetical protein
MNKIWTASDNSKDRIIALANNTLYHGNPKSELVNVYVNQIKNNEIPKDLYGIPLSYIRQINLSEKENYIEVLFGNEGSEHFRVADPIQKKEIFDFFKETFDNFSYQTEKGSESAVLKPLIAFIVVLVTFLYTLSVAQNIESGAEYELRGNGHSSAGLILLLASLGSQKVAMIFGGLIIVTIISMIRKTRDKSLTHKLILKKS